jgi:hypothetical protein
MAQLRKISLCEEKACLGEVPSPRTALKKLKAASTILEANFILYPDKRMDGISVVVIKKYRTVGCWREQ